MPFPRHQIQIVGNLGKEPEMRYTPSGQPVTAFSVAVSRKWTDGGGQEQKETTWYNVSAWGKTAEQLNGILHKGMQVMVIGRPTPDKSTGGPRIWTRTDGSAGASFEITAQEVWLSIYQGSGAEHTQYGEESQIPPEDEIPF